MLIRLSRREREELSSITMIELAYVVRGRMRSCILRSHIL